MRALAERGRQPRDRRREPRRHAQGDASLGIRESRIGSNFADTLTGDAGNNVLDGGGNINICL